jgi:hypothetical protein
MAKQKREWRELAHSEKMKYAMAMRRLNLGYWGYPVSTLKAIHLTTREGNDNTTAVFARDLRELVGGFRAEGYDVQYCGALEYTPGKGLLHWHGLFRVKGGYFILPMSTPKDKAKVRRVLGDRWNVCHGAFVVEIKPVRNNKELREYITKHIMKEYVGEDEDIRNKFLFSKGWMREGWKEVESIAKGWVLGGASAMFMNKERWALVNEIMLAWAEKKTAMFLGKMIDGKRTGYLSMELGRICEAVGGAFSAGSYEYYNY